MIRCGNMIYFRGYDYTHEPYLGEGLLGWDGNRVAYGVGGDITGMDAYPAHVACLAGDNFIAYSSGRKRLMSNRKWPPSPAPTLIPTANPTTKSPTYPTGSPTTNLPTASPTSPTTNPTNLPTAPTATPTPAVCENFNSDKHNCELHGKCF